MCRCLAPRRTARPRWVAGGRKQGARPVLHGRSRVHSWTKLVCAPRRQRTSRFPSAHPLAFHSHTTTPLCVQVRVESQAVPELRPSVIAAVKDLALQSAPPATRAEAASLRSNARGRRWLLNQLFSNTFEQPGANYAGPAEIATMRQRLAAGAELQVAAKERLMSVRGLAGRRMYGGRLRGPKGRRMRRSGCAAHRAGACMGGGSACAGAWGAEPAAVVAAAHCQARAGR